jgi:hypothetical protein
MYSEHIGNKNIALFCVTVVVAVALYPFSTLGSIHKRHPHMHTHTMMKIKTEEKDITWLEYGKSIIKTGFLFIENDDKTPSRTIFI